MADKNLTFTPVFTRKNLPTPPNATSKVWNVELAMFGKNIAPLIGVLGGGYYLHNISLPIYRNSKRPEMAVRDMFLGYTCVCLSYIACGSIGAIGFQNPDYFAYLA